MYIPQCEGKWPKSAVLSALLLLFSLRQCLSLNMEFVWDDWPMSSRDPPGSAPVPPIGGAVIGAHARLFIWVMGI